MVSAAVRRAGVPVRSSGGASMMRMMRTVVAGGPPALPLDGMVARLLTTRPETRENKNTKRNGNQVVVIGGGCAGIQAARGLDKAFDVVHVAGGESFRHVMFGVRAAVLPEQAPRMLVSNDSLLKKGVVKTCPASKTNAKECAVNLATGESLPYDYLVLATGSLHPKTPGFANRAPTNAEQTEVFKESSAKLKAAQDILVVGGGPVGIEMAGEIVDEMPGKNVTLVTSKELMPSPTAPFPDKFRNRLRKKLEEVGVAVHTDAGRVDFNTDDIDACGFVTGKKTYSCTGGEMKADLCIVCTGATQPSSLYADSGLAAWLNEKGAGEDTLEVKEAPGAGKVFAIGDCIDLAVPKLGFLAVMEGANVVKQIKASAAGKPLKSGKPPALAISIVPVGKSGGVSYLLIGAVVGDCMTKKMKSEDVFVSKIWGDLKAGKSPVV